MDLFTPIRIALYVETEHGTKTARCDFGAYIGDLGAWVDAFGQDMANHLVHNYGALDADVTPMVYHDPSDGYLLIEVGVNDAMNLAGFDADVITAQDVARYVKAYMMATAQTDTDKPVVSIATTDDFNATAHITEIQLGITA